MKIGNIQSMSTVNLAHFASSAMGVSKNVLSNVYTVANHYFIKARFISSIALHSAWSITKNFASATTAKTATIAHGIFNFSVASKNVAIEVSKKVGTIAAVCFSKAAHITASTCIVAKDSAVYGAQVTKLFFATHQKETMLVGCGIAIGAAAAYAVSHFYPTKAI